jgi:hypothetical protein
MRHPPIKHSLSAIGEAARHIHLLNNDPGKQSRNQWRKEIRTRLNEARKWTNRMSPGVRKDAMNALINMVEKAVPEDWLSVWFWSEDPMVDGKQRGAKTNVVAANSSVWGKHELRELKRIEANLPSWSKPKLREIKRIMTKGSPEARAFARLSRKLCEVLESVSPRLDSKLLGRTVARLVDSLFYADVLSANLHEMTRIEGPSRRERIRSILLGIREVVLDGQRRQIEGLRRDIPLMLKQLSVEEASSRKRQ